MQKHLIWLTFCVLFLCFGCQPSEITLPIPEPKLVVYAFWQADHSIEVRVQRSSGPVEDTATDAVNNATVVVYENDAPVDTLRFDENGLYKSSFKPRAGHAYHLEVHAIGFAGVVSEKESMPERPDIAQVLTIDSTLEQGEQTRRLFSLFNIVFERPLYDTLFFTLNARLLDIADARALYWLSPGFDCGENSSYSFNGIYGCDLSCWPAIAEISFETSNEEFDTYAESKQGITLCRVNEAHHEFHESIKNVGLVDDGLFSSPTLLPSNIEGGYGLLSLSTCTYFEIKY
ncbi:MAG TPA: DUF4249 domain-containing protein [Saprospiraceae bacterium]|nr:DUF4249 domain-containing protein [Saprospiraceae bacterium]HMQ83222.1 DUF4249 domain-containing protein [Saprospiraceae bacterium]